jgi:hypothetical protein
MRIFSEYFGPAKAKLPRVFLLRTGLLLEFVIRSSKFIPVDQGRMMAFRSPKSDKFRGFFVLFRLFETDCRQVSSYLWKHHPFGYRRKS